MVVGGWTMLKLSAADLPLDHTHSRAICDEIGERLRTILKPDGSELPPRLLALIEKLAQLETGNDIPYMRAPPTAPSLEDMNFGETRNPKRKVGWGQIATSQRSAPADVSIGSISRRTASASQEQHTRSC